MTLSGGHFITTTRGGERNDFAVSDDDEFSELLRKQFGIELDRALAEQPELGG